MNQVNWNKMFCYILEKMFLVRYSYLQIILNSNLIFFHWHFDCVTAVFIRTIHSLYKTTARYFVSLWQEKHSLWVSVHSTAVVILFLFEILICTRFVIPYQPLNQDCFQLLIKNLASHYQDCLRSIKQWMNQVDWKKTFCSTIAGKHTLYESLSLSLLTCIPC